MANVTDVTAKKKEKFIASLSKTGNVTRSCESAGVAKPTVYRHRDNDAEFAQAWDLAIDDYIMLMEQEADRRAAQGLRKKKFLKNGDPVIDPETGRQYEELEFSDTLLMFRLKALRPDKYRDNMKVEYDFTKLTDEELVERAKSVVGRDVPPGVVKQAV